MKDSKKFTFIGVAHEEKCTINEEKHMSLDEFWELTKKIDWPNNGHKNLGLSDYEKEWGGIWEKRLRRILEGVLQAKSYLETGSPYRWPSVSDDSFWDLTSHIVGLGKNIYLDVLKEPKSIENYLSSYEENFGYCFPDKQTN